MIKLWIFNLSLLLTITCFAKQPNINARDVQKKVGEILAAHASFNTVNEEIMERSLTNFIEELDPHKCYFLEKEVKSYLTPSKELTSNLLGKYTHLDFSLYNQIYNQFLVAIERRGKIEKEIVTKNLSKDVDYKEFKNITWAKSYKELSKRLLDIRSLQVQSSEKLDETAKEQVLKHIEKRRVNKEGEFLKKEEQEKHLCSLVLKSIASSLDSHTNYFTPNEANQFMIQVQQRLFGIGAQLRDTLNGLTIVRIIEGGPAEKSDKLKINDRIIAVGHEPIVGMDISEGVEKIRGEKGTPVLLTICRENNEGVSETFDIKLTRNEIVIEETRLQSSCIPYANGVIAYLKLHSFYQDQSSSSSSDIRKALEEIQKEHKTNGVLLDLRGNTGGLLSEAVGVTGLFIHQGIVVSVKDNTGSVQHLRETDSNCFFKGPMVVLTDRASASASEIVAQSLQDYGRAFVVGDEYTFGKGSFQTLTLDAKGPGTVDPKGEYKVTRGKYYTVSGKSPQLVGVKADIAIPGIFSNAEIGEKFSKFPLENDDISANFEDSLEDVPFIHRFQATRLYKSEPQKVLTVFNQHLPILKNNSQYRIQKNTEYQTFLEEIKKENYDHESVDHHRKTDSQRVEAENILKDLIFLHETVEKKAAS